MWSRYSRVFFALLAVVFSALHPCMSYADTVKVYLEDAIPLHDETGEPIVMKVLREVERISDLHFVFTRATYARCLNALKAGEADMVAHVPYQAEPGFSKYGIYLDWTVPVKSDLVSLNPAYFNNPKAVGAGRIGVPRGNLEFASDITGIPADRFYEVSTMESLVKMLVIGHIDMIWFDRVSVRQELAAQKIINAYYYELPKIEKTGSLGVGLAKSERGESLKRQLDGYIAKVDVKPLLKAYTMFLQADKPQTGRIVFP